MSEPTAPRGTPPPDPLEELLRAAGRDVDYPPTPPLASAVRARLEREADAPPANRWRWLPWRRYASTPRQTPTAEVHQEPTGRERAAEDRRRSPWSSLRWAVPSAAAALAAMAVVFWMGPKVSSMFSTAGASLAGGSAPSSGFAQRPAAPPAAIGRSAEQAAPPAAAPAHPAEQAPPPAAAARGAPAPPAPAPTALGERSAVAAPTLAVGQGRAPTGPSVGDLAAREAADAAAAAPPAIPLADAVSRVGFRPLLPAALGAPDAVYARSTPGGAELELVYGARPGFDTVPGEPTAVLIESALAGVQQEQPFGEPVTWDGHEGRWVPRPEGAGGTLYWTQAGLHLRLSTGLPRDRAVAIAASVGPAGE